MSLTVTKKKKTLSIRVYIIDIKLSSLFIVQLGNQVTEKVYR